MFNTGARVASIQKMQKETKAGSETCDAASPRPRNRTNTTISAATTSNPARKPAVNRARGEFGVWGRAAIRWRIRRRARDFPDRQSSGGSRVETGFQHEWT